MMWRTSLFLGMTLLVFCSAFSKVPTNDRRKALLPKTRLIGSNGKALPFSDHQDRVLSRGHDQSLFAMPVRGGEVSTSNNKRPITLPPHRLSIHQLIYVILTATFVTCLIVADVIGVKIFELKLPFPILGHTSVEHTCGMLTFPITFLLGDIINEYYGPASTKMTVYIGLAMSVLVFFVMNLAQAMPYLQKPFNGTFSSVLIAYADSFDNATHYLYF